MTVIYIRLMLLYSYLNLESTKTKLYRSSCSSKLYSYLNLESTKTMEKTLKVVHKLYSYLNLESTKTCRFR